MTEADRQILINQIAILETLALLAPAGARDTREHLKRRYHETAQFVREHSNQESR